ncbi:MAG TPA: RDD family protein [Solirubrobacter sp.]|nr:RDD family protein [Solirubrobacter sp.]
MSLESQAPPAPPPPVAPGPSGPRAGFWIRFGAYLLDGLILTVPGLILIAIATQISGALTVLVYLLWVVGAIAYPIYFEGGPTGATPGKRICGIRVYDLRAGAPQIGYGRAFVRMLIKGFISGSIFFLGFLWMLWDREKQTWHDKIADTVVVPTDAYR